MPLRRQQICGQKGFRTRTNFVDSIQDLALFSGPTLVHFTILLTSKPTMVYFGFLFNVHDTTCSVSIEASFAFDLDDFGDCQGVHLKLLDASNVSHIEFVHGSVAHVSNDWNSVHLHISETDLIINGKKAEVNTKMSFFADHDHEIDSFEHSTSNCKNTSRVSFVFNCGEDVVSVGWL